MPQCGTFDCLNNALMGSMPFGDCRLSAYKGHWWIIIFSSTMQWMMPFGPHVLWGRPNCNAAELTFNGQTCSHLSFLVPAILNDQLDNSHMLKLLSMYLGYIWPFNTFNGDTLDQSQPFKTRKHSCINTGPKISLIQLKITVSWYTIKIDD